MAPWSDAEVQQQLVLTEDSFFRAIHNASLDNFDSQFNSLHQHIKDNSSSLSSRTSTMAYSLASKMSIISQGFLDLEEQSSALNLTLASDMGTLLDEIYAGKEDGPAPIARISTPLRSLSITPTSFPASCRVSPDDASISAYAHSTYAWFLDNLHNPYPSLAVKQRFAKEAGVRVKVISDWFVHIRRRVGWTGMSKRHFGGDRSLTADCAHRVLVERTGHMYYSEQVVQEIEDMKEVAKRLCEEQGEQSSLTKRLNFTSFPVIQDTASRSRKRRRQDSPPSDNESIISSSTSSSNIPLRKRSRETSEERECAPSSSKRRSISSRSSSSLSHTASFTSCSSASVASSSGPLTPLSSPTGTHSKLPTDIFNNWIDDVSSELVLLPPDAADQPCSVLSQKRALSDSDEHHTAKRARLEQPPAPSATTPVSHPATLPEDNGPLSNANELALSMPPLLDILPIAGEGDASGFGNPPPLEDANPDLFSQFLTQLERQVPSVTTWDDSLLGSGAIEAVPFDFGGSATAAGNADTPPSSSVVDFFSLFGLEGVAEQDNSEAANMPLLEGQAKGVSEAVLLSSTDLAFLEGLGSSEDGDPDTWSTCADSPGDTDSPATLVDTLSSSQEPELEDEERTKKLRRLQELLEEAEKLKQEVYG